MNFSFFIPFIKCCQYKDMCFWSDLWSSTNYNLSNHLEMNPPRCVLPAVCWYGIFWSDTGEHHSTPPNAFVNLVIKWVTTSHLHDVQPAGKAQLSEVFVQSLDLGLFSPLVGDEQLWRHFAILLNTRYHKTFNEWNYLTMVTVIPCNELKYLWKQLSSR